MLRFLVWAISAALGPGALLAIWERHKGAIHGDESWAVMAFLYCGMGRVIYPLASLAPRG